MKGNPDDQVLLNHLKQDPAVWSELQQLQQQLSDEDRHVTWAGGEKTASGTIQMPYALYSERLKRIIHLLSTIGAVTPEYHWMKYGIPKFSAGDSLSPADAVRSATAVVRGERFNEGTIAKAVENDLLEAILNSLITWYIQGNQICNS